MTVAVRLMRAGEERTFLSIHTRAIRGLATSHYTPQVLDAWTVPQTDEYVRTFSENADGEIRLIAEIDGEPVGLGALVMEQSELRACYVVPEAARNGVGTAIVCEIERIAMQGGVSRLDVLASLNAEPFYRSLGYVSRERTEYMIRPGVSMAALKMTKQLA